MPTPGPKDAYLYILDDIKQDVDRLTEKSEAQIVTTTKLVENFNAVSQKVTELNKLLTVDNGKPSILSQLHGVNNDIKDLKAMVASVQKQVGVKTPQEAAVERWKTIGKIGVAFLTIVPGLLAFFHDFM